MRISGNVASLLPVFQWQVSFDFAFIKRKVPVKTITMALPIWKRKHDLIYLIFFLTHIPIMFCKIVSLPDRTATVFVMRVEVDEADMGARC